MLLRKPLSASIIKWQNFCTSNATLSKGKKPSPLAELRKKSGYGLSLCKDALAKNENDVAKALQWLDEQAQAKGWDKANKLEGRTTAQGLIGIQVLDDSNNSAVMVELNCETDFVARNKNFVSLLQQITDLNIKAANATEFEKGEFSITHLTKQEVEEIKQEDGKNLADLIALNIGQIGENLSLKRAVHFKSSLSKSKLHIVGLTHPAGDVNSCSYGRWGVLLALEKDKKTKLPFNESPMKLGIQLCNHIIGMNPETVGDLHNPETWPKKKETELETKDKSEAENEDDDIETVDANVAINSETEMIHQPFLFDSDLLVRDILLETGIDIKGFVRFEVGQ